MEKLKAWFSFIENNNFSGQEPPFFDISQKPFKKHIEACYEIILKEFNDIIKHQNDNIIPYYNQTLASNPLSWTIFPLKFWGKKNTVNCLQAPETIKILENIPGVITYGFSILKPFTKIKPHCGDSNVMYRCHFALKCKGNVQEIGMRVKDETITWENGKMFSFCDAHNHEVWNNTAEERWILIVDILREPFLFQEKKICKLVNASLWWQIKFQNFYFLKHIPRFARRWIMNATAVVM